MSKILVGSPVRQKYNILKEFLKGLEDAEKGENTLSYYFVDDNTDKLSSGLLQEFAKKNDVIIKKGRDLFNVESDYDGHNWKASSLAKVTVYKNEIIQYCIEKKFDYLFLIDSDIVIDKRSILQLLSDNVDIVSNVFWNQWFRNGNLTPQCFWIPDIYVQEKAFNVPYTFPEADGIKKAMIEKLKKPGLYEVDGLGACTMITRHALEMGVSFKEIYNLRIPGEDRPFCIRAGALGFTLYMDTFYPAYHISKDVYLDRVEEFKRDGFKFDMCQVFEKVEVKKRRFKKLRKLIIRVCKKIVRELTD